MSSLLDLEKLLRETATAKTITPTPEVTTIPRIPTPIEVTLPTAPLPTCIPSGVSGGGSMVGNLAKSITDVTDIDFSKVFSEAVNIFAEQALMTKNTDDINIKELQLSKAKADNFLAAIDGMTEISHKVELLAAEKYKFKRIDELKLLNNLREQFEQATSFSAQTINMCINRLNTLATTIGSTTADIAMEDLEKLGALQGFMENAINTLNTISSGAGKLIKTERESGGRSVGNTKTNTTNINTFLKTFESGGNGGDSSPTGEVTPRQLTEEELQAIMNKA